MNKGVRDIILTVKIVSKYKNDNLEKINLKKISVPTFIKTRNYTVLELRFFNLSDPLPPSGWQIKFTPPPLKKWRWVRTIYLKKDARNEVGFLHAGKHQVFHKLILSFLIGVTRHAQSTQNKKFVIF